MLLAFAESVFQRLGIIGRSKDRPLPSKFKLTYYPTPKIFDKYLSGARRRVRICPLRVPHPASELTDERFAGNYDGPLLPGQVSPLGKMHLSPHRGGGSGRGRVEETRNSMIEGLWLLLELQKIDSYSREVRSSNRPIESW
jgi:hypothetical protein